MKFILPLASVSFLLWNCSGNGGQPHKDGDSAHAQEAHEHEHENAQSKPDANGFYGTPFEAGKAVDFETALANYKSKGKEAENAITSGNIGAVCQGEGCWLGAKTKEGETTISFGDKFVIPKDTKGKFIASGSFYTEETSVEDLKAEAKEEGKSQAEIDKIKAPVSTIKFKASGLKLL